MSGAEPQEGETMARQAYEAGLADGADWELSAGEPVTSNGWSDATCSAMGASRCRRDWGVAEGEEGDDAWGVACREYDRGVVDALRARGVEVRS